MEAVAVACAILAVCCWPDRSWLQRRWIRSAGSQGAPDPDLAQVIGGWRGAPGHRRHADARLRDSTSPAGDSAVPGRQADPATHGLDAPASRTARRAAGNVPLAITTATPRPRPGSPGRKRSGVQAPDVATAMDLLALVTASGRGVAEAIDRVAAVSPPRVRADLATVVAAQAWGVDDRDSWSLVSHAWEPAAASLTLAATAGVAPSGMLVRAAADYRAAHAEALDLAAARLGVRLVLPLGLAFLPAFVLLAVVPLVVALAGQVLR